MVSAGVGELRLKELSDEQFNALYGGDRFTASVIGSKYRYIVKHMCTHLMANAFSPILRDWYDFSSTLTGPPELGYPMAAVADSLIIFTGAMSEAVRNVVGEFGPENLQEGDILVCNDPYRTGTHINDVCFIRPVFYERRIVGFVNIEPHLTDIGGAVPGGMSPRKRNVYEDGLVIPPMLLYQQGRPVRSALSLIFENVRFADVVFRDVQTIASDLALGEQLLQETIERYGVQAHFGALRYATDVSAEAMSDAVLQAPDGVYEGDDLLDCDGIDDSEAYLLHAKVTIAGPRVEVDLSGSSGQARTSINASWLEAKTVVGVALKYLLDPKTPFTSGTFRPVDVVIPAGSIMSALPPNGPTTVYGRPSSALLIAIFKALGDALGMNGVAGDFCDSMAHNANGRRADGSLWITVSTCGGEHGPWGATRHGDAENSLSIPIANAVAPSMEQTEREIPVVLMRKEYATDTAGVGAHRGGAATVKDSYWFTASEHHLNSVHLRSASGFGVYGGGDGPTGGIWLWPGKDGSSPRFIDTDDSVYADAVAVAGVVNPDSQALDPNGTFMYFGRVPNWAVGPGTMFRYQTAGGGGWGDPLDRPPAKVLSDVRDEYYSPEFARERFGVVVIGDPVGDPERLVVDERETAELRARMLRALGKERTS
jgi:N-methylhydantoinase B